MVICRSLHETPTFELRRLGSTILLNNEHEIHGYAKRGRVLANKGYHGPETAAGNIDALIQLVAESLDFGFVWELGSLCLRLD